MINLDFADAATNTIHEGQRNRIIWALAEAQAKLVWKMLLEGATNSPLLETQISGARAVLINTTGRQRSLPMFDCTDKVASQIDQEADENAIIILGASIKEEMQDEIAVTVIAAGFEKPQDMDILNSPVIPNKQAETKEDGYSAPVETAPSTEDAYKGECPGSTSQLS